jgi:hypothetical protein
MFFNGLKPHRRKQVQRNKNYTQHLTKKNKMTNTNKLIKTWFYLGDHKLDRAFNSK